MGSLPVVLVEGRSDVAAVQVLARRRGLVPGTDLTVVDMGGVTNIRREWTRHRGTGLVLVLCDGPEADFVGRVLADMGAEDDAVTAADVHPAADSEATMARDASSTVCFVCDRDLEDELLRALGPDLAAEVVRSVGLGNALDTFRSQTAWRDRAPVDQLRRFAGAGSGRKELLAGAWADALPDTRVPPPLQALLERVRRFVGEPMT